MKRTQATAWVALVLALTLAIGGGAITQDLTTLVGAPHAEKVVASARIIAALLAAATGAVLPRKPRS